MRVLIVVDTYGWAFYFVAQGIQKYSKHECIIKRWDEINREDKDFDCLFCLNDSVWYAMGNDRQKFVKDIPKKCVGIRGEQMPSDRILSGWTIGAVNHKIYNNLKKDILPVKGIYLTRNGVDTDMFKPVKRPDHRFIIGWAGNPTQHLKRFYLLRQIQTYFPVKIAANYGRQFFVKNRSRDEMIKYYSDIDVFINVSSHEGMPQTILEAAATKLPIIVTDVGGMSEFVDSEWVVPVQPDSMVISMIVRKLGELKEDIKLRRQVGERNLKEVLNNWSWNKIVKDYEQMFEGIDIT